MSHNKDVAISDTGFTVLYEPADVAPIAELVARSVPVVFSLMCLELADLIVASFSYTASRVTPDAPGRMG